MALAARDRRSAATTESRPVRWLLTTIALAFLTLFLLIPLVSVFWEAFSKEQELFAAALTEPEAVSAIRLTLLTAAISVPLNVVFGVAMAWAIRPLRGFPAKAS